MNKNFKSGFISVVGLPNVGKSTLINAVVGQKIAATSDKPQTTRNRILGIHTTDDFQMIFTDTPGIHKPKNKLGEYMVNEAAGSIPDADIIVFVTDASREMTNTEREIADKIKESGLPAVLVINKTDCVKKEALFEQIAEYNKLLDFEATVPLSAKNADGTDIFVEEILKILPEGPMFYPAETVTDAKERTVAAEIIREKMLVLLDKEVPHGVAVEITKYSEKEHLIKIDANIYCEKESHKGIIIGRGGKMMKKIGEKAREDIEKMTEKKVFLQLWVKVKTDWRNSDYLMKSFGFKEERD